MKSPAEGTSRRRLAKYIVLLGSSYIWVITDLISSIPDYDTEESKLAEQSFKENSIPIYAKVVFASYKRDEIFFKRFVCRKSINLDKWLFNYCSTEPLYLYLSLAKHQ